MLLSRSQLPCLQARTSFCQSASMAYRTSKASLAARRAPMFVQAGRLMCGFGLLVRGALQRLSCNRIKEACEVSAMGIGGFKSRDLPPSIQAISVWVCP